jgi:3-oxoacyl-[acyl-carrier protein] reductase
MDLGIAGKVALVTAASRGLGKAVALELAREGCKLAICARSADAVKRAADEIRKQAAVEVLAVVADVGDGEQVRQVVAEALERFGSLDILFANAGGPPPGDFVSLTDEHWLDAVNLNLMSVVHLCREVLPAMQRRQWGRIVIDTSFTVKQPMDNLILSNSIRAGVTGLAKTLSNEVAKDGITVNCVCPGWIQTERVDQILKDRAQRANTTVDDAKQAVTSAIPMGRIGRVDEFAAAAAFLCSARASYITGVSLQVDGGIVKGLL